MLENRKAVGPLSPQHFIVKTLVTTQMIRRIGDSYGVRTIGDLLVGFKWIAQAIDAVRAGAFHLSAPRNRTATWSARYARDKDGAVASLLLCELAATLKAAGQNAARKAR